jgi:hypothetical protein
VFGSGHVVTPLSVGSLVRFVITFIMMPGDPLVNCLETKSSRVRRADLASIP